MQSNVASKELLCRQPRIGQGFAAKTQISQVSAETQLFEHVWLQFTKEEDEKWRAAARDHLLKQKVGRKREPQAWKVKT